MLSPLWLFVPFSAFLIWAGFESATNGHKALGGMLTILGAVAAFTGAALDVYLNHQQAI